MAFLSYGDRVKQVTSNTSGTVTLTLSSTVPTGFVAFSACPTIGIGAVVEYTLEDADGIAWEQGEGTVGATTLTRDTVNRNHLGTQDKISLTAGTHTVFCTFSARSAYRANPHLDTPSITSGSLTIDLRSASDSAHRVTLNQNIVAGGITLANAPVGVCRAHIQFEQATPGGTTYDVPAAAWPTNVLFVTEYQVYTDATPTVIQAVTLNGGANYVAESNYEPAYQPQDATLSQLSTLSGNGLLSLTAGNLSTTTVTGGGTVSGPTATTASQIALFSGTDGNLTYATGTGYITASGGVIGYVAAAASSVLVATASNAVQAMTLGASTVFGQRATGNIGPITYTDLKTDLALNAVANVDQLPRQADSPVTITASTTLSSATHGGKNIYCNNTAAITLSITSGTPGQNLQCLVIMSNTATVNIASIGSELINGSSATVASISARWKSAYIHKYASNATWVDAG